ncbi:MAG: tetratricopeptide repeat protein [Ardenticatenales bacterium]|nr:tetratricopeptide repeat protein [Ardenticatenales bacterium]
MSFLSRPRTRYPEWMLLIAFLLFAGSIATRLLLDRLLPPTTISAPRPAELSDEQTILKWQEALRQNPENSYAYTQLGLALLQRVRETADPMLYNQAEQALTEALQRDPQQLDAMIGQGILALARHDFQAALGWGEKAHALSPHRAQALGVMVDALVELGRYEEAAQVLQQMVNLRPDLPSYSRVSYLRELHGDTAGAIAAMQQAVQAGRPGTESMLWTQVQLGHLYFNSGDLARAEEAYRKALYLRPDYAYALAGAARVQAARGDHQEAIVAYQQLADRLPLPEFVIALGELYEVTGKSTEAERQYDLVRAIQQINGSAGMAVDMELALFDADHGENPEEALQRARRAYRERPSLYAADALAWTLYHAGHVDEARQVSQEVLRLGTRDAALLYRAGVIAHAAGEPDVARDYLQQALQINPFFSLLYAPRAQALLDQLAVR